jgi:glyoxylase-like metal-dependent hydrolase (beta-lactamase superfamily II)
MNATDLLPRGVSVFERGWLSSNNVLMQGDQNALVDSGYFLHSDQTVALVAQALQGCSLDLLANTHLHSDHCGGNAALQAAHPALRTLIPPAQALAVDVWDMQALTYEPTGQRCPRFGFDAVLVPGSSIRLGEHDWQIHAAPGHDPHSLILFEPQSRCLISADALWENGFGVVFPELEGVSAFDEVADTLDLIEQLAPQVVIPGHGAVFTGAQAALSRARARLAAHRAAPDKHARHAAKVLIKYHMLEFQSRPENDLLRWIDGTAYFHTIHTKHFAKQAYEPWREALLQDLLQSGALQRMQRDGVETIVNV